MIRLAISALLASASLVAQATLPSYRCQALPDGATSPESSTAEARALNDFNEEVVGNGLGPIYGGVSTGPMQWNRKRVGERLPDESDTGNTSMAWAAGISANGKVVGAIYDSQGQPRPVAWQDGVLLELGSLAADGRGYATAVSTVGTVAGKSIVVTSRGDVDRATLWRPNGKIIHLHALDDKDDNVAYDVNEASVAVGMNLSHDTGSFTPVRWESNGTIAVLPNPPQGQYSSVRAISAHGVSVGSSYYDLEGTRATAWRGLEPVDLGGYDGGVSTEASDINGEDAVVGFSEDSRHRPTPLYWASLDASAVDLNTLVKGGCTDAFGQKRRLSYANAINSFGVIAATAIVGENGDKSSFAFRLVPR